MSFTTTVITTFDDDLFETCYQSNSQVLDNAFLNIHPRNLTKFSTLEEKKSYVKNLYERCHTLPDFKFYKITDNATGQDIGYEGGLKKSEKGLETLKILFSLYRSDIAYDSWVVDYLEENLLNQQNSIATQLDCSRWSLPVYGSDLEQFYHTVGIKRWLANGSVIIPGESEEESFVVFISPWGWPVENIEP